MKTDEQVIRSYFGFKLKNPFYVFADSFAKEIPQ
jgi:hypothetical protein